MVQWEIFRWARDPWSLVLFNKRPSYDPVKLVGSFSIPALHVTTVPEVGTNSWLTSSPGVNSPGVPQCQASPLLTSGMKCQRPEPQDQHPLGPRHHQRTSVSPGPRHHQRTSAMLEQRLLLSLLRTEPLPPPASPGPPSLPSLSLAELAWCWRRGPHPSTPRDQHTELMVSD